MRIHVDAHGFVERSVPLGGKLGEAPLQVLLMDPDQAGFTALLRVAPRPGAELEVGYEEPRPTGFRLHELPSPRGCAPLGR